MKPEAIVAAARVCLGARFRPQGRDPATGLDCLGLVLFALDAAGYAPPAPRDYALSASDLANRLEAGLRRAGFGHASAWCPGDIMLFEPAPGQAHLAVATNKGLVHAHLGVGRVVEGPADPAWELRSVWRFGETF